MDWFYLWKMVNAAEFEKGGDLGRGWNFDEKGKEECNIWLAASPQLARSLIQGMLLTCCCLRRRWRWGSLSRDHNNSNHHLIRLPSADPACIMPSPPVPEASVCWSKLICHRHTGDIHPRMVTIIITISMVPMVIIFNVIMTRLDINTN